MFRGSRSTRRQHGAAMLLVLIAVAMCTIMALSFLAAQEPTAAVAANIDRKTQARAIAESALKMAIDYVNEDADWRSDKSSGVWMTAAALDGGTFDLYGTDEDDGDLSDDSSEPVTLSVVATYDGVTHRVSAKVTPGSSTSPGNRLLLVAGNGSSPSSDDRTKRDLFESWGYTVTVIDDSSSQSTYDAAVAVNDVVYISEDVSSGSVNTKLRDVTIGVVSDEGYLADEFGFTTSNISSDANHWGIEITDSSHPITAGFTTGDVYLHTSTMRIRYVTSTIASGVTVLADRGSSYSGATLMAAETGAALHYGEAAGRRVMYAVGDSYDFDNLSADGEKLIQQAVAWAAGGASGSEPEGEIPTLLALYEFDPVEIAPTLAGRWKLDESGTGYAGAVQVIDDIDLYNGSTIDAYDASAGPYGGANQQLSVRVFTNSTSSGDVYVSDSTVYGDIIVGAGGSPSSVIATASGGSVTGNTSAQSSNIPIPTYDAPGGSFGSNLGNKSYSGNGNSETWSSNKRFNDLTIKSNATITIDGDVSVLVQDDFDMNNGTIVLNPGASLVLWVGSEFDMSNGSSINNDTTRPGDVQILLYGNSVSDDFTMNDSTIVGTIHSADDVRLYNGSAIYGSLTNEDDLTLDDSALHIELSTSPPDAGGSTPPTVAADSSGLANDGAVNGSPTGGVAGQHGTAFEFNGASDYVEIPHDDSYLMQAGTFSVWFKADSLSGRRGLFSKDSSNYDTGGHFSVFTYGSQVEVRMQSTTDSYYVYSGSGSISTGNWYHIMFAWGEEGMALYLDGVLVDTDSYTGGLGTTSGGVGNYEPIVLGANAWGSGDLVATPLQDYFDGTLDDLRIYNERLSESQAMEIYNGATEPSPFISEVIVEDTSGYENPLDLAVEDPDNVTWSGGGITFDGDTVVTSLSEAVKLHDAIEANGEFSVELLVTPMDSGTTSSPSRIISYADGASAHNLMFGQESIHYQARVRDSSNGSNGVFSPEFQPAGSFWNFSNDRHVVLSYKEGEASVYIDGQLDHTQSTGGTLSNWDDDHYLVLGGAFGGGSHWRGTIKRVAIYDRGFNAGQANNVFNGNDPGSGQSAATGTGSVQWDEQD